MGYMGVAIREGEDGRDGERPIKLVVFVFLVWRLTMTETDWRVGVGKTRWRSGVREREMVGRI